jgi:hypothetical protein
MCLFNTINAQQNNVPSVLDNFSCEINFTPSITTTDLEYFVKQYNATCANPLEVDLVVKADRINFRRLPSVYNPATDIIPSVQQHYGVPDVVLGGDGNIFGQRFRMDNLAFYEANRGTILTSGYELFTSSERVFGN